MAAKKKKNTGPGNSAPGSTPPRRVGARPYQAPDPQEQRRKREPTPRMRDRLNPRTLAHRLRETTRRTAIAGLAALDTADAAPEPITEAQRAARNRARRRNTVILSTLAATTVIGVTVGSTTTIANAISVIIDPGTSACQARVERYDDRARALAEMTSTDPAAVLAGEDRSHELTGDRPAGPELAEDAAEADPQAPEATAIPTTVEGADTSGDSGLPLAQLALSIANQASSAEHTSGIDYRAQFIQPQVVAAVDTLRATTESVLAAEHAGIMTAPDCRTSADLRELEMQLAEVTTLRDDIEKPVALITSHLRTAQMKAWCTGSDTTADDIATVAAAIDQATRDLATDVTDALNGEESVSVSRQDITALEQTRRYAEDTATGTRSLVSSLPDENSDADCNDYDALQAEHRHLDDTYAALLRTHEQVTDRAETTAEITGRIDAEREKIRAEREEAEEKARTAQERQRAEREQREREEAAASSSSAAAASSSRAAELREMLRELESGTGNEPQEPTGARSTTATRQPGISVTVPGQDDTGGDNATSTRTITPPNGATPTTTVTLSPEEYQRLLEGGN